MDNRSLSLSLTSLSPSLSFLSSLSHSSALSSLSSFSSSLSYLFLLCLIQFYFLPSLSEVPNLSRFDFSLSFTLFRTYLQLFRLFVLSRMNNRPDRVGATCEFEIRCHQHSAGDLESGCDRLSEVRSFTAKHGTTSITTLDPSLSNTSEKAIEDGLRKVSIYQLNDQTVDFALTLDLCGHSTHGLSKKGNDLFFVVYSAVPNLVLCQALTAP